MIPHSHEANVAYTPLHYNICLEFDPLVFLTTLGQHVQIKQNEQNLFAHSGRTHASNLPSTTMQMSLTFITTCSAHSSRR